MKYRAEIDGLRALAVFPVILFHNSFLILLSQWNIYVKKKISKLMEAKTPFFSKHRFLQSTFIFSSKIH